jgi:hypothetical protein
MSGARNRRQDHSIPTCQGKAIRVKRLTLKTLAKGSEPDLCSRSVTETRKAGCQDYTVSRRPCVVPQVRRTAPQGCVTWAATQVTPLRADRMAPVSQDGHEASQQRALWIVEQSSKSANRGYFSDEGGRGSHTGAVLRVEVHPTPRWIGPLSFEQGVCAGLSSIGDVFRSKPVVRNVGVPPSRRHKAPLP